MTDLRTQLARYGCFLDEEQSAITALEILSKIEDQVVSPRAHEAQHTSRSSRATRLGGVARAARSVPRPWAAIVAAILVLFLLGVIPTWLSGSQPDAADDPAPEVITTLANTEPGPTSPEGASPAIEPTDLDMTEISIGTLRWTRVSGDVETLPEGNLEADSSGSGFVVHDVEDGIVWRSPDGLTWARDSATPPRDPADWVAPWVSEDGAGWSLPQSLFPEGALIYEVDFGWVATDMPQSRHLYAISTDGETWEEVLGPPGPHMPSGEGSGTAGAVGNLLFMSLGEEESGARTLWIGTFQDLDFQPPDTWPAIEPTDLDMTVTTIGTLSWTRVSGDAETLPGHPIEADGSGGYLVREPGGVVWRSSDGLTWARDTEPADPGGGETDTESSEGAPTDSEDGQEAFGTLSSGAFETNFGLVRTVMPQSRHLIEISADGTTWEEVLGPPGPHEPSGDGLSAAGAVGDVIWVLVAENAGPRTLWIGSFGD